MNRRGGEIDWSKGIHSADLNAASPKCSATEIFCHSTREATTASMTSQGIAPTWAYLVSGLGFGVFFQVSTNWRNINRNRFINSWHSRAETLNLSLAVHAFHVYIDESTDVPWEIVLHQQNLRDLGHSAESYIEPIEP